MRKVNLAPSVFTRSYCCQGTEAKYKEMCGIVFHYTFMNTGTVSVSGMKCLCKTSQNSSFYLFAFCVKFYRF